MLKAHWSTRWQTIQHCAMPRDSFLKNGEHTWGICPVWLHDKDHGGPYNNSEFAEARAGSNFTSEYDKMEASWLGAEALGHHAGYGFS